MDPGELRRRRHALKMTRGELGKAIGMHRNSIALMENEEAPILERTALAVQALKPAPLDRRPSCTDPMERTIELALIEAGIQYTSDQGGETSSALDFHLTDLDIAIEVKRFYTARTGEQMARAPNVIVAQGEVAVRFLAQAIRSGDFLLMVAAEIDDRARPRP